MTDPGNGWPHIRARRLQSDFQRLQTLVSQSEFIHLDEVDGDPPDHYLMRFTCAGVARVNADGQPELSHTHRVQITLPPNYPTRPPQVRWLTPLFHPNVAAEGQAVCIGSWFPSRFLDELCITLGRMIQYHNYDRFDALRRDAALWAHQHQDLLPVDNRPLRRGSNAANTPEAFDIHIPAQ